MMRKILVLLSLVIISCNNNPKKNNLDNKDKEATSVNQLDANSNWELVWSDEFDGDSINTDFWNLQVVKAGRFNDEWQRYTNSNENAYIDNNCLVIKAIHESDKHGMDQYTSARINTANKYSFKYGKIAARIKLPQGKGIWPAFWMLGSNIDENGGDTPWPQCGEIDILELYGSKDDAVIEANLHYADATESHKMAGVDSFKLEEGVFADDFHVFELEWNKEKLTWLVDGKPFKTVSITKDEFSEFHEEFFILLNIAVGGAHAGRPDGTTIFPQLMYVDWVRVYEKNK